MPANIQIHGYRPCSTSSDQFSSLKKSVELVWTSGLPVFTDDTFQALLTLTWHLLRLSEPDA